MKLNNIPWRKIIVYVIYILIIPSLQVTLSPLVRIAGQTFDLMLVFAVLTGFLYGFYDGLIVGAAMGLMRDLLAAPIVPGPEGALSLSFGIGIIVLLLAGVFGSIFMEGRTNRNFPLGLLAVLSFTLIYKIAGHLIIYLWESLMAGMNDTPGIWYIIKMSILPQVLMNLTICIPAFFLLRFLGPEPYRRKNKEGNKELNYGDSGKWLTI
ncbi:hypothetical protein SAMN02910456_00212 [Ruminococcaceae bacterium YRB3002]|nr:hypothetical protein SAMN02910456_00212 [Ruminococcaceae bacterium YRB3002]